MDPNILTRIYILMNELVFYNNGPQLFQAISVGVSLNQIIKVHKQKLLVNNWDQY